MKNNEGDVAAGSSVTEQQLFNDLLDISHFESEINTINNIAISPVKESTSTHSLDFSRFKRIPIGTFWHSQRMRSSANHFSGGHRRLNNNKSLKKMKVIKSNNNRILESTLLSNNSTSSPSSVTDFYWGSSYNF